MSDEEMDNFWLRKKKSRLTAECVCATVIMIHRVFPSRTMSPFSSLNFLGGSIFQRKEHPPCKFTDPSNLIERTKTQELPLCLSKKRVVNWSKRSKAEIAMQLCCQARIRNIWTCLIFNNSARGARAWHIRHVSLKGDWHLLAQTEGHSISKTRQTIAEIKMNEPLICNCPLPELCRAVVFG